MSYNEAPEEYPDDTRPSVGASELKARLGGSLFSDPPREVWIVSTPTGPDHVALTRECAMEHAAIMAGDFPELGPWRVCKYVAEPFTT